MVLPTKANVISPSDFADILPIRVFLSMMDLPEDDIPQTKYWTDQLIRPDGTITFADALQNLKDYIAPYVDQRMGADGTDMLSRMINTETNGRRLTREEAIKLSIQVFIAGVDTVVNLLGFVFLFLARNKPHRQQIIPGKSVSAMRLKRSYDASRWSLWPEKLPKIWSFMACS